MLAADLIRLVDPEFTATPLEIAMNPRYMPHFKVKKKYFLQVVIIFQKVTIKDLSRIKNIGQQIFCFCRIALERLMEHMYVHVFYKKFKYHLLVETVYRRKI